MLKITENIKFFVNKLRNSEGFNARIARGTIWSGMGNGSEQILRLIRNMILTRILAPEAFGLMAIVLAVNAAFESFTQIGIKEAVIQNPKGQEKEYLNGAWWLAFGRAVVLYGVVYFCAPLMAQFYGKPDLIPLMRVAFLGLVFNGLMSSGAYVAIKKMNFKRWVLIWNGGSFLGIITAVALAVRLQNVWALVIGFTVEHLSRCILSYIICPFLPRFRFSREHLSSLFKYARGMVGLPILTFIFMRTDVFVIGRFLAFENLGLYAMASAVAWMPFNFITMIVGQVMMPALSERQSDTTMINRWTIKVTSMIAFIGFPALAFLAVYGRELLTLIYGAPYGIVAVPFVIIFCTALIRTCSVPMAAVYLAIGKPELHRLFTAIRAVLIVILIYPALKWQGLVGAALAGLGSMSVSYLFQIFRLRSVTGLAMKPYFAVFLRALLFSIPVLLFWAGSKWLLPLEGYWCLLPGSLGCLIAYASGLIDLSGRWRTNQTPSGILSEVNDNSVSAEA